MTDFHLSDFERRRRELMQLMGSGVAVFPTAPEATRNGDVLYPFRPDSDFYYLTHFPEPAAVAVLVPGRPQGEFILFCRERNSEQETWTGRRRGLDGAVQDYGADDAFPIDDIAEILPGLLEDQDRIYCNMGRYLDFDNRLLQWVNEIRTKVRTGINAPGEIIDVGHILHELRLVKRKEEIQMMKRAARVSAAAHCRAMRACCPDKNELEIESELEYEFRKGGAHAPAYPSIVAGGANACILHYTENCDRLLDGDLLLIDAGAEIDCYASDITRTFPINGHYSGEQRALYDVVLLAQEAAIDQIQPGITWNQPHEVAVRVLTEGLVDLGLLVGPIDALIEDQKYRRFYMHRTGHWLGMDVHDVGDYKVGGKWRVLEPGMTLTVEPGLYVTPGDDVDARWHNLGIRIEDDVLVTRKGCEILTADVPKRPEEIEALMVEPL
jgi:Xaa-Pro aminopeptidase